MKKKGSTLIECMVYLLIVGFVTVLSYGLVAQITQSIIKDNSHIVSLYLAHDILLQDIKKGLLDKKKWKYEPSLLIFQTPKETIGWEVKKNTLFRSAGTYDFKEEKWKNKKSSVVARSVDSFSCTPYHAPDKTVLKGAIKQSSHEVSLYCVIPGRV